MSFVYNVPGSSADDVWAAGGSGGIAHWDGIHWSPVPSGVGTTLNAIWINSSCDVWFSGVAGVLLHWNGSQLLPVDSGTTSTLYGLWGAALDDIWAAGTQGTIIHWNGSQWLPIASGTNNTLRGISGSSSGDIWTVGSPDPQGTLILHWDGGGWSRVASPAGTVTLYGVSSISQSDAWAAGTREVFHWNGFAWSAMDTGFPDTFLGFAGVWARGSDDVWLTTFGVAGPTGTVAHWDGLQFTQVFDHTDKGLFWIWGVGDDLWAGGALGTVLHHRLN